MGIDLCKNYLNYWRCDQKPLYFDLLTSFLFFLSLRLQAINGDGLEMINSAWTHSQMMVKTGTILVQKITNKNSNQINVYTNSYHSSQDTISD